jgi:hypothetical protein
MRSPQHSLSATGAVDVTEKKVTRTERRSETADRMTGIGLVDADQDEIARHQ